MDVPRLALARSSAQALCGHVRSVARCIGAPIALADGLVAKRIENVVIGVKQASVALFSPAKILARVSRE